jgi:hypothetical protein
VDWLTDWLTAKLLLPGPRQHSDSWFYSLIFLSRLLREEGYDYYWSLPFYQELTLLALILNLTIHSDSDSALSTHSLLIGLSDCYIAAGPRQHSYTCLRVPLDSWLYFTLWRPWEPSDPSLTGLPETESRVRITTYFTVGGLPAINSPWSQAHCGSRNVFFLLLFFFFFFFQLSPCERSLCVTPSLTRGWVCLLWICLTIDTCTCRTCSMILKILPFTIYTSQSRRAK